MDTPPEVLAELDRLRARVLELETLLAASHPPEFEAMGARSSHWSAVRYAHLKEHPTCEACGGTECLNVHHRRPFHLHPTLELEPRNLITLCELPSRSCHLTLGHSGDWKAFNPHVRDDAALMLKRRAERRYD